MEPKLFQYKFIEKNVIMISKLRSGKWTVSKNDSFNYTLFYGLILLGIIFIYNRLNGNLPNIIALIKEFSSIIFFSSKKCIEHLSVNSSCLFTSNTLKHEWNWTTEILFHDLRQHMPPMCMEQQAEILIMCCLFKWINKNHRMFDITLELIKEKSEK